MEFSQGSSEHLPVTANSGPSGLESSAFFNPLWLRQPTEQSHCGSVVLVVAEVRHFFGIRINMNAKDGRAKRLAMATVTLCNTVFMLMLLAALSTCYGNAFGAWSGKQRKRKKAGYLQIVALDFKLLGVWLELGTFGYRAQSSNHSTTPPMCQVVPQPISACRFWPQIK